MCAGNSGLNSALKAYFPTLIEQWSFLEKVGPICGKPCERKSGNRDGRIIAVIKNNGGTARLPPPSIPPPR